MRLRILPLLLLAAAGGAAAWGFSPSSPPAPRFAVVPAAAASEGKAQLESLQDGASAEGFLDRILGTNCFTAAVGELNSDCRRMEQEAKTRLALRLTNCQLAVQGSTTHPCGRRQSLQECTQALPDRAYSLFVEFLTHADTMCLFIQNQNFERYTENMLNRLAEGAGFAQEQLAAAAKSSAALGKETAEVGKKAAAALELLRQHGEMEEEALKLQKKSRAEAQAYFLTLDAKQQQGLDLQDQALQRQAALEAGQASVLAQLAEAQGHVAGLLDLVEGRAAELAAAAARQAEAQAELAGELGALSERSAGIRSAVDVVLHYQQRSDSVLMRLLGKSYSLEDVAFYGAGMLGALAAGASRTTARAKLPVLALLGASLVAERMLVDWLHVWMDVGESGELLLSLPVWGWLAPAAAGGAGQALWQFSFKWAVRRVAAAAGALMLGCSWLFYRDFEKEGLRMLLEMEREQRRRHEEYLAAVNRQKIELAALLGGGGSGGAAQAGKHAGSPFGGQGKAGGARAGRAAEASQLLQLGHAAEGRGAGQPAADSGRGLPAVRVQRLQLVEVEDEEEELPATEDAEHDLLALPAAQPQPRAAPKPAAAKAAAPAGRKRRATDESESVPPARASAGAKRQTAAGTRRLRSSASEEVPLEEEEGGRQQGKRARRSSAEGAAIAAATPAAGAGRKKARR